MCVASPRARTHDGSDICATAVSVEKVESQVAPATSSAAAAAAKIGKRPSASWLSANANAAAVTSRSTPNRLRSLGRKRPQATAPAPKKPSSTP
jgi:hypothetical protein